MEEEIFKVGEEYAGKRLDVFVSETIGCSRSHAQKLIEEENVKVGGLPVSKSGKLQLGCEVWIKETEAVELNVEAENIPLDIVFEDEHLLVVNKPKGMVVHPAAGNFTGTLVNALLYHCKDSLSGINGVARPGIVHRIDKNTSGLLIVAKNDKSHAGLAEQIKEHSFMRKYNALVFGTLKTDEGTVDAPIGRHKIERKKMAIVADGRNAVTHYKVLERFTGATLVECKLETGRTHQIRVHMSSLGHPVIGDDVYGVKKDELAKRFKVEGQMLHAKQIGFVHPVTGEYLEFDSNLPDYFQNVLAKLRKINE